MATLADVIRKRRESGQGVGQSLAGSLKEKLKEKIDPRRFLNQSGIITALFPKLKAFKASGSRGVGSELQKRSVELTGSSSSLSSGSLSRIKLDSEITAKNSMVLPALARDMNIMRQNIAKLLKEFGVKPTYRSDRFFKKSKDRETEYESAISTGSKSPEKLNKSDNEKESSGGILSILGKILPFVTSIGGILISSIGKLKGLVTGFLSMAIKPVMSLVQSVFSGLVVLVTSILGKILKSVLSIFSLSNMSKILGRFLIGTVGTGLIAASLAAVAATYGLNAISNKFKQDSLDKFNADPSRSAKDAIESEKTFGKVGANALGIGTQSVKENYIASQLMKLDPTLTAGQALNKSSQILEGKDPNGASAPSEFSGMDTDGTSDAMPLSPVDAELVRKAEILSTTGNVESKITQDQSNITDTNQKAITPPQQVQNPATQLQGQTIGSQTQDNKENIMGIVEVGEPETVVAPINQQNNSTREITQDKIPSAVNDDIVYYFGGGVNNVYA